MNSVQRTILQTEYHLNQAKVETNLAKGTAKILSSSSIRFAQYVYTWWDWMFRGCVIGSGLVFAGISGPQFAYGHLPMLLSL